MAEYELAETIHGEIVRIVKRRSLMEPLENSNMSIITVSRQSTPDELAAEMDRRGAVIEQIEAERDRMRAALELFMKQWNACGPNSDFGRYFSNVRDAAKDALSRAEVK